ncbi:hypothetical protein ACFS07_03960 [Undibacterium arcticum]
MAQDQQGLFLYKPPETSFYSVGKLQEAKSIATLKALRKNPPEQWTVLPGFEFTVQEIAEQTNIDSAVVKKSIGSVLGASRRKTFNFPYYTISTLRMPFLLYVLEKMRIFFFSDLQPC